MKAFGDFLKMIYEGMCNCEATLWGKYTFSLWDIFMASCIFGIIGYFVWRFMGEGE